MSNLNPDQFGKPVFSLKPGDTLQRNGHQVVRVGVKRRTPQGARHHVVLQTPQGKQYRADWGAFTTIELRKPE